MPAYYYMKGIFFHGLLVALYSRLKGKKKMFRVYIFFNRRAAVTLMKKLNSILSFVVEYYNFP